MTKDEALRMALEALEADEFDMVDDGCGHMEFRTVLAITAIKQALEQPEPEPVAWEHHAKKLVRWLHCMSYNDSYFGEPAGLVKQVTSELNRLIGTPPPKREWVGLNYFEQVHLKTKHAPLKRIHYDKAEDIDVCAEVVRNWGVFFEAIEAKLKEKNA